MLLWTSVYKFLHGHMILFLFGKYLGVELQDHRVTLCSTIWRTARLFSKAAASPLAECEGSNCSASPPALVTVFLSWLQPSYWVSGGLSLWNLLLFSISSLKLKFNDNRNLKICTSFVRTTHPLQPSRLDSVFNGPRGSSSWGLLLSHAPCILPFSLGNSFPLVVVVV